MRDMAWNAEEEESEPHRYSWECERRLIPEIQLGMQKKKKVNPRDIAGNTEEEEEAYYFSQSQLTDTRPTSHSADPIVPGDYSHN